MTITEISLSDIAGNIRTGIRDFGTTLPAHRVVLRGGRVGAMLPSGLVLNLHDTRAEADCETRMIRAPNLVLHMVLEGGVEASLGDDRLPLSRAGDAPVRVVLSALARPAEFRRRFARGQRLRKLTVVLDWDWLAARGVSAPDVLGPSLHRCETWLAAPSDVARAEALLSAQERGPGGPLETFEKEALAMSLVRRGMEALLGGDALRPDERARLTRMEAFADRPGPLPPVEEIAAVGGMSVSSLRRLFRRAYGQPVQERLRTLRLERAAAALRTGTPVSEAARLAGYATATAFATAFRQATGHSPSQYTRALRPSPAGR